MIDAYARCMPLSQVFKTESVNFSLGAYSGHLPAYRTLHDAKLVLLASCSAAPYSSIAPLRVNKNIS